VKDGLGYFVTRDIVSDRQGRLWIATGEGVSLLLDETEAVRHGRKFQNFLLATSNRSDDPNDVNRIVFDAENRLWGVTSEYLYRAKSLTVTTGEFERVAAINTTNTPAQMMLDRRGRLWVSGNEKLLCVTDGSVTQYRLWEEAGETTRNIYTRLQRFSDACDLKYFISAIFHIIQLFPDARSFSIAPLLKLKLELSTLDARR
jgi:ligand-binding sensor domain-containing protein